MDRTLRVVYQSFMETLDYCFLEREALRHMPDTFVNRERIAVLDGIAQTIWRFLDATTPRSYGDTE